MDGNPIKFPRSKASRIAALFDVVVYMAKIFAALADCVYSAFVRCVAFSWPTATDGDSGEPKRRHYFDSPSERNARRTSKRNQKCNKHILSHSRTTHTRTMYIRNGGALFAAAILLAYLRVHIFGIAMPARSACCCCPA